MQDVDTQLYIARIATEHVHIANRYILFRLMSICSSKRWRQPQEVRKHHVDKLHWRTCKGDCKHLLNGSVTHQLSLIVVDVVDVSFQFLFHTHFASVEDP